MSDIRTLCGAFCGLWLLPRGETIKRIKTFNPKIQAACYRFEGDVKLWAELAGIKADDFLRQGICDADPANIPGFYYACVDTLDEADLKLVLKTVAEDRINLKHQILMNWVVNHFFYMYSA